MAFAATADVKTASSKLLSATKGRAHRTFSFTLTFSQISEQFYFSFHAICRERHIKCVTSDPHTASQAEQRKDSDFRKEQEGFFPKQVIQTKPRSWT